MKIKETKIIWLNKDTWDVFEKKFGHKKKFWVFDNIEKAKEAFREIGYKYEKA